MTIEVYDIPAIEHNVYHVIKINYVLEKSINGKFA